MYNPRRGCVTHRESWFSWGDGQYRGLKTSYKGDRYDVLKFLPSTSRNRPSIPTKNRHKQLKGSPAQSDHPSRGLSYNRLAKIGPRRSVRNIRVYGLP